MKNLSIIILIVLAPFISVYGQYLGSIQAGGNYGNFDYGDQINGLSDFENSGDLGLTGGFNIAIPFGSEFTYISPGLFYQMNGSDEFYSDASGLVDRNISLDYVGLALPLEMVLMEGGSGISLDAGLYFDYAIAGDISSDGSTKSISFNSSFDRLDIGYNLNLSIYKEDNVGVEFGYTNGLKNIKFLEAAGFNSDDTENYLINNGGFTLKVKFAFE